MTDLRIAWPRLDWVVNFTSNGPLQKGSIKQPEPPKINVSQSDDETASS